jgi:hypothetical protein
VVYTRVVCSACRGTGREPEIHEKSVWSYALVIPLMILALVLALFGGIVYERTSQHLPRDERSVDVIKRVGIGMDEEALKVELGDPDEITVYEDTVPPVEIWSYRCRDRYVLVRLKAGIVSSVRRPGGERSVDIIKRVEMGIDDEALKDELGEPDKITVYEDTNPPVELWTYRCRDKSVQVRLKGKKVASVE